MAIAKVGSCARRTAGAEVWGRLPAGVIPVGCGTVFEISADQLDEHGDHGGNSEHQQPVVRENRAAKRDEGDPGEALEIASGVHVGGGVYLT